MKMEKLSYVKVIFIAIALLILDFGGNIEAAPEASLITSLPGFDGFFPSKHYSGYVTIEGESKPKNLFYYLVQSEGDPSNDPVVLWLNGGPGCSSFDGFVYEHGPFNFEAASSTENLPKLHLNPYSWSKVSNILYLDSPNGVGFSYSKNSTIYKTGDLETAVDTHNFLLMWFSMYPELLSNPFYIAGESYAGIYIPTLASNVAKGITTGQKPIINFKGYMIGNGVTDNNFDGNAFVPFAHGMAVISEDMYTEAVAACNGKFYSPTTDRCSTILHKIDMATNGLNIYDILEPCYHDPSTTQLGNDDKLKNATIPSSFKQLGKTTKPLPIRKRIYGRSWPYKATERVFGQIAALWPQLMQGNRRSVPCTDDKVATSWLNNAGVKKALHVSSEFTGTWDLCTGDLRYKYDVGSMIDYHKNLTSQGYRAYIQWRSRYVCSVHGSEAWTRAMGYKIIDEWRSWTSNDQVAGYTQGYDHGLTFLTVKGSGHTVPEYKPREALDFYTRWLQGNPI